MNLERQFRSKNATTRDKEVRPLSESIKNLEYWFNALNEALAKADAENARLRDENYKSEELAKMEARMKELEENVKKTREESLMGFPISKSKAEKIAAWKKNHDTVEHSNPEQYHGASGGGYSYRFYPTAIGTFGSCYCEVCRKRALDVAYSKGIYNKSEYSEYLKKHDGKIDFQIAE